MIANSNGESELKLLASYASQEGNGAKNRFKMGESLVGQAALEKRRILLTDVPNNYAKVSSGLSEFHPSNIVVLPILFEGQVKAQSWNFRPVQRFSPAHEAFLDQLTRASVLCSIRLRQARKQKTCSNSRNRWRRSCRRQNLELEEKARSNLAKDTFWPCSATNYARR